MKQLLFAAALIAATATTGFAQQSDLPPLATAQEIQTAKTAFNSKLSQFQTAVSQNKTTQAEGYARELFAMMRTRAGQVAASTHYGTTQQRDDMNAKLNKMESVERDFMIASKDMKNSSAKAVTSAQTFVSDYY